MARCVHAPSVPTWDRRGCELPHDHDRTSPRARPVEEQHDLTNFDLAFGAIAESNNVSDHDFSKLAPARTSDLEAIAVADAKFFSCLFRGLPRRVRRDEARFQPRGSKAWHCSTVLFCMTPRS